MQQQPDRESRKSLPLINDPQERGAQTQITINDEDDKEPKIRVFKTCQTVIQIDFDASYETAVTRLEYAPAKEILKEAFMVYDLPKKNILQFNLDTDLEKKSSENLDHRKEGSILQNTKSRNDAEIQTKIRASPHILDGNNVAEIVLDDDAQTDITYDPDMTNKNIVKELNGSNVSNLKQKPSNELGYKNIQDDNANLLSEETTNEKTELEDVLPKAVIVDETEVPTQKSVKGILKISADYLNESTDNVDFTNRTPETNLTNQLEAELIPAKTDTVKFNEYAIENQIHSLSDSISNDDLNMIYKSSREAGGTSENLKIPDQETFDETEIAKNAPPKGHPMNALNPVYSKRLLESQNVCPIYINVSDVDDDPPPLIGSSDKFVSQQNSTIKPTSAYSIDPRQAEKSIKNLLEMTIKNLECMLSRMVFTFNKSNPPKLLNKCVQSNFFAGHIPAIGDMCSKKIPNVLCECQLCGPGGGAVPKLGPPPLIVEATFSSLSQKTSSSLASDIDLVNNSTSFCRICNNTKFVKSAPDLSEHHIRLLVVKSKSCHCAKSDLLHKYTGLMEEKKIIKSHTFGLLVDEDGDYTDSYLELLYHDQVGIQTELDDERCDCYSPTQIFETERCFCDVSVEMPWDLITYQPYEKKDKVEIKEIVDDEENVVDEGPVSINLCSLTVSKLKENDLIELTKDRVGNLVIEDFTLDNEKLIPDSDDDDFTLFRKKKESSKEKYEDLPKPKPFQVFSPTCERHNEPYMDRMFTYFPDDCDLLDPCSSTVEMPWDKIILPKSCIIRKIYKPNKKRSRQDLKRKCSRCNCISNKATNPDNNFKISFAELSSTIFKKDQIIKASISNMTFQPKKTPRISMVQSSFSQPDIKMRKKCKDSKKGAKKVSSGDSKIVNVHEFEGLKKHRRHKSPVKSRDKSSKTKIERVAHLLDSCKKEMAPIREGINQLRAKVKELNLSDYGELPKRTSFSYISSYSMLSPPMRPDLYPVPYWGSYFPYCAPYTIPCPMYPSMRRSRSKSPSTYSSASTYYCSEVGEFIPSCNGNVNICQPKSIPTTSRIDTATCVITVSKNMLPPKASSCSKPKPSKIPKLRKKIKASGKAEEKICKCNQEPKPQENAVVCKQEKDKEKCTLCSMEEKFIKACEAVNKSNLPGTNSVLSVAKISIKSKVQINVNNWNKYKPTMVDRSSYFNESDKEESDRDQKPENKQ